MESLNLNTLANSLPIAQQNAEKELLNNFKAAALSITTLYRSSRQNSKRAYNLGYAAACQDLLNMIQQGVSAGSTHATGAHDDDGMTIGRVMDWTEARLEAIRSREEEEEEEEEREKEKERERATAPTAPTSNVSKPDPSKSRPPAPSSSKQRPKDTCVSPPTPNSPASLPLAQLAEPSSPSPPPSTITALRPIQRPIKTRLPIKVESTLPNTAPSPLFDFVADNLAAISTSGSFPESPISIGAGAKRRHAVMMMLDSASSVPIDNASMGPHSPMTPGSTPNSAPGHGTSSYSRRRTRSTRMLPHQQHQNQNINVIQNMSEAMDVEEEGRERKRVARR